MIDEATKAKLDKLLTQCGEAMLERRQSARRGKDLMVMFLNQVKKEPESYYFDIDKLPSWIKRILDICFFSERSYCQKFKWNYTPEYYRDEPILDISFRVPEKMTKWVEIALDINLGIAENLSQIDWQKATSDWDDEVTEALIECLDGLNLQLAAIDCILCKWRLFASKAANADAFDSRYESFLTNLRQFLETKDSYDVSSIRGQETDFTECVTDETDGNDVPADEGHEEASEPKRRGRPVKSFADFVEGDQKDKTISAIGRCLEGKSDKTAALVIYAAWKKGLILKPQYSSVKQQFPDTYIGSTIYSDTMSNKKNDVGDVAVITKKLEEYMS